MQIIAVLKTFLILVLSALGLGGFFYTPPSLTYAPQEPAAVEERAATTTAATPIKKAEIKTLAPSKVPPPTPALSPMAPAPAPIAAPAADINALTRAAVVNILCTSRGDTLRPISGSGVLIDSRGVILTNAHVAQYLLLKDYPHKGDVECVIREGNPAYPKYRAVPLYIPSAWISLHARDILETNPLGTGEFDFAFLLVTEPINKSETLPSFPALTPELFHEPPLGNDIFLASYPAQYVGGITVQSNLYQSSAFSKVFDVYTFATSTTDLISTGGTVLAQKGSSGGAVVDAQTGKLWGLVVTSAIGETTGASDLRAITLSYIERALTALTGTGISAFTSGNIRAKADNFNLTVAPTQTKALTDVLNSR